MTGGTDFWEINVVKPFSGVVWLRPKRGCFLRKFSRFIIGIFEVWVVEEECFNFWFFFHEVTNIFLGVDLILSSSIRQKLR